MESFLDTVLFSISDNVKITVHSILAIIATIVVIQGLTYLLNRFRNVYFERQGIEAGRRLAIYQILKYVLYIVGTIILFKVIGLGFTGLLVGSGALLVGIGFGLQQTFNDFLSGVIILFEGGVQVGDNLLINDLACTVHKIGVRTTEVVTRDDIKIIIPNSMLASNSVINWSHNRIPARFNVDVRVSLHEDIDIVERLLLECALEQHSVRKSPAPQVHLMEFAESSINFRLYFYSRDFIAIEKIKSDIRKRIYKRLSEHNIDIPYPQRDLWIRQEDVSSDSE